MWADNRFGVIRLQVPNPGQAENYPLPQVPGWWAPCLSMGSDTIQGFCVQIVSYLVGALSLVHGFRHNQGVLCTKWWLLSWCSKPSPWVQTQSSGSCVQNGSYLVGALSLVHGFRHNPGVLCTKWWLLSWCCKPSPWVQTQSRGPVYKMVVT